MGHACQKCNVGVSVPPLPVKVSPKVTLTGPIGPVNPHNRSLKSRLSHGVGDPERRELGRLVRPDGPRMPKVQCGVSVPPLPVESVAEGYANCPYWPRYPLIWSLKSRLSHGVGDPERRNLADLFGPMGHACQKCNVALSVPPLPVKVSPKVR
ncbi:hypothetical protein DPMN_158720 [Dreissena polymorpha]|uniref:Uncharacterized protein n=1 Tax=Dreissena polymorpha TaxID=45954 RepID=A0A9D4EJH1_DREPO|nr:hypothetical protein DPMN_158720 [Dreissena polymorpha]